MSGFGSFGSPPPSTGSSTPFAFGTGQPNQQPTFGNNPATVQQGGNPFGNANNSGFGSNPTNTGMPLGTPVMTQPTNTSSLTYGTPTSFVGGNPMYGASQSTIGSTPFGASSTSFGSSGMTAASGPTFGATPAAGFGGIQTNIPTSGFGSFNAPSSSISTTSFGNSGLASSSTGFVTNNFGSTPSQQSAPSFGQPTNTSFGMNPSSGTQSNNAAGFGSNSFGNTGGFNSTTTSSGFGSTTNAPSSTSFGNTGFGNTGFASSSTITQQPLSSAGYGPPSTSSSFGMTTNTSTPFGGSQQAIPFGSTAATPFGTTPSSSQFGIQGPPQTFSSASSTAPFGASPSYASNPSNNPFSAASSTPATGFGASSINTSGFGFNNNMNSTDGFSFASSNINHSDLDMRTSPVPTGISLQSMSPMKGGQSDSEDMGDGDETNMRAPASNLPFGRPVSVTNTFNSNWGSSANSSNPFSSPANTGGLTTIQESEASMDSGLPSSATMQPSQDEVLATLKAKIEQKKKRLEEKRKKEETFDSKSSSPVPGDVTNLTEKNAIRFATRNIADTKSHLPTDLLSKGDDYDDDVNPSFIRTSGEGGGNRGDLENAVSLMGTCINMCPDEEITRRERESDIQLLEKPLPGTIHPSSWTLRDTMVKRFRRSAADYKLDVPEWVRPPDVLERVCGYLEEWVMERDRQGRDQRFVDSAFTFENGIPPSLDVYQFIWDRTRMVRKDFILQNYVGTGGKCDARAVRCHERIARWHAMCEHQLSHIPEFVTKQSQQNIQELGQTMKTLNQYYDDSLNRSTIEVPDENGKETRFDLSDYNHGCCSNSVQGPNPIDFNTSPLMNDGNAESVKHRLIGSKDSVNSPYRGTAEPEMRGLYILLTLENDGGMEVLKYAARLFQDRPALYHSVPVQLAMSIYKARKEFNYARFFAIMRSYSTPYLFACIMFKYVETMRKTAFKIMSRTYGGRSRENEPIHDAYALKHLTELLCFEDDDETKLACQHFNITVKSISGVETIFWKQSPFKEPKDPEKDTLIRLLPRKMLRTIESKINGVTRLAVCRGETSGEGACIASSSNIQESASSLQERTERLEARRNAEQAALAQMEIIRKKREEEAVRCRQEEIKHAEMEKRKQEEDERRELEEEKRRLEFERMQQREKEERERLENERIANELEKRRKEEELAAARKVAEQAEIARQREQARVGKLRRDAEERARQEKLELEQKRLKAEEERNRLHLEMLQKQEEERQAVELERLRQERERMRMEAFLQAEAARKKRTADALRMREEANKRILLAKKKILLLRWIRKLPRHILIEDEMHNSLNRISPLAQKQHLMKFDFLDNAKKSFRVSSQYAVEDLRMSLDRLLKKNVDVSRLLAQSIWTECHDKWRFGREKVTLLFSVAIVIPLSVDMASQSLCDLVRTWINSRLGFRRVASFIEKDLEIRVKIVDSHDANANGQCDLCCFVIPPPWSDSELVGEKAKEIDAMASSVADDIPRVVFALHDRFEKLRESTNQRSIVEKLAGDFDELLFFENHDIEEETIDKCLSSVCELVAKSIIVDEPTIVACTTFERLAVDTICQLLRRNSIQQKQHDLVNIVSEVVHVLFDEISVALSDMEDGGIGWPSPDFAEPLSHNVENYFPSSSGLPLSWTSTLHRRNIEPALQNFTRLLNGKLSDVVWNLIGNAPFAVQSQCQRLLDIRNYRSCLQQAFMWKIEYDESHGFGHVIYITKRLRIDIMHSSAAKCAQKLQSRSLASSSLVDDVVFTDAKFLEEIDPPPSETPAKTPNDDSANRNAITFSTVEQSPIIDQRSSEPNPVHNKELSRDKFSKRQLTNAERDSMSFTKRLKRLAAGHEINDMMIGKTTLGAALRSAPPVTLADIP